MIDIIKNMAANKSLLFELSKSLELSSLREIIAQIIISR